MFSLQGDESYDSINYDISWNFVYGVFCGVLLMRYLSQNT